MKATTAPKREAGQVTPFPRADRRAIVLRCFEAYEKKDRSIIDPLLSGDFTFGSPIDDDIDRESYFARCWPNSKHVASFKFERLIEDGDDVVVTYLATNHSGAENHNTEIFSFRGDKITHVQVYFGNETGAEASGSEIAGVIEAWAEGLRRKDAAAVASHFTDDAVGFSLAPPLVAEQELR